MGALKLLDAVEDNLDATAICNILKKSPSSCNGVAFRHYTGNKSWKVTGAASISSKRQFDCVLI